MDELEGSLAEENAVLSGSERTRISAVRTLSTASMFVAILILLYYFWPRMDLFVADIFYLGHHEFIGSESIALDAIRAGFNILFYAVCICTFAGVVLTYKARRHWMTFGPNAWRYLAICLLAGPLLTANVALKNHWGRARPRDVVEFSGAKTFTSPLTPAGECHRNCSFVSGEASAIYIVFFAIAFILGADGKYFVALGWLLGTLAGLVRMVEGAHFLSDVIFAGVFMAMTASITALIFRNLGTQFDPPIAKN